VKVSTSALQRSLLQQFLYIYLILKKLNRKVEQKTEVLIFLLGGWKHTICKLHIAWAVGGLI